ncbi:unnamed protein product [Adineta ricciae]|uniref:VCBS repeat-containing protein n=1 Tax=Adineta ricciae TaxID=249248 RepID=A0A814UD65_ADIRI|nr:unnamed protein product [Adineta ricciae]
MWLDCNTYTQITSVFNIQLLRKKCECTIWKWEWNVSVNPNSIVSTDFNSNHHMDLVTFNQGENTISILHGDQSGTFQTLVKYKVDTQPTALLAGDFNRDSKINIAAVN